MITHPSTVIAANFTLLAPWVGTGNAPGADWHAIADLPLVILVGVTGVGKSTTLQALHAAGLPFQLLPDRRDLTDQLIIGFLQQQAGEIPHVVSDRTARFALTRRYREQFPGGMSHAVSRLLIKDDLAPTLANSTAKETAEETAVVTRWWFFDGLRGVNEVAAAAELLPAARFIVLDAPDVVRVQRLLGRSDSFDQVTLQPVQDVPLAATITAQNFAAIGVPEADELFSPSETALLLAHCAPPVGLGDIAVDQLRAKLKIVAEERRNYDPSAALQTLANIAANRTLAIDTTRVSATAAATQIVDWLTHQ